ncbi:hypothetical protein R3L02_41990 [Streptomyces scabiei]|uniref:hypothetical protein n=1 Tax=Streptomyces scabiei TaxID=1930 RepID=UPI00298ED5B4|nr:hypothetical protein [Streptomyces scabiei]MDW8478322.1 hypothetical protein [Streptomyces scabiei]
MHASQAYGGGFVAELGDRGGETFGVQSGGVAKGAVLVDALPAVGHDQGHQGARAGHHTESELDQFEQRLGVNAPLGLQLACTEQVPAGVEHGRSHHDRGDEGQDQDDTDGPQTQTAPFSRAPGQAWIHDRED